MIPAYRAVSLRQQHTNEVDGAFFGPTFAHLFLMQFPHVRPKQPLTFPPYVPKVFGFKVVTPQRIGDEDEDEME